MLKKTLYIAALTTSIILLFFAVLFTWRPDLVRVLRYRVPDAETYKVFPQAVIRSAGTAFQFKKAAILRDDLDTVLVKDWENKAIPFKTYLNEGQINLFMVIRNDTIIYEKTTPGYSDTTLTSLFSISKSMLSIVIGKALEQGKIKSLDDHIIQYIPELKANPVFNDITLRHLFTMTSGLEFKDTNGGIVAAFLSDEAKYYYTDDIKKLLLAQKSETPPGIVWKYKSIDAFLLTWALENATGQKVTSYFENEIWKKIGTAHNASFGLDHNNGLANTASRFQCTAIDLAKIGRLYLNGGKYNNNQVINADWVKNTTVLNGKSLAIPKGWQKTTQNYLWWLPQQGIKGEFAAEGMLGQRLFIDKKNNTIIIQLAAKGAGDYPYRKVSSYLSGKPFLYPENK